MSATAGDSAAASVFVRVPIEDAFEVFTNEIDMWWRHGRKYRIAGRRPGRLGFEPRLGGRLFETVELESGERTFEVGEVVEWEPPHRISLVWRGVNFAPGERTFLEITFRPVGDGTMVRVEHTGWSELRDDHPARHGLTGPAFSRMIGLWWGDLLTALREHVATRRPA